MRIPQLMVVVASVAASSFTPAARLSAQDPPPVPLSGEPRHHVVYESPAMRVHDIQIPPGDTTLFHTHDTAILYVPIARSTNRSQVLGAEWTGGAAAAVPPPPTPVPERPGPVNSVTTYVEKPYTHRVNNVGTTLFRLIGIANRTAGAGAAGAADDVSGLSAKPELENPWYRAHRIALAPGTATASHRHASQVVDGDADGLAPWPSRARRGARSTAPAISAGSRPAATSMLQPRRQGDRTGRGRGPRRPVAALSARRSLGVASALDSASGHVDDDFVGCGTGHAAHASTTRMK